MPRGIRGAQGSDPCSLKNTFKSLLVLEKEEGKGNKEGKGERERKKRETKRENEREIMLPFRELRNDT
jgi:hypothetical protein